ncbi:MAG: hypothetical protein ACYC5K_04540 [Saccharofermentanales bacterium]
MFIRFLSAISISAIIVSLMGGFLMGNPDVSAASAFYFKDSMGEATLNNYLARSVTFEGLCGEGGDTNFIIDEDIRMLLRTGTKFVSRAALFAWTSVSAAQVEEHFAYAKQTAAKVHAADPEIILQAFVAEIVRKVYVNNLKVPAWVFEAFGKPVEVRNFSFDNMINLTKGPNYWGTGAGYPDYSREEAQLWYYYCIRRYIDAGFESIHIQEGEDESEIIIADKILTMSREYAKTHARRGIVLFHNFFSMLTGGNKIGDRLLFDIQGNGIVPIETVFEDGAMKCKIGDYRERGCELQWLGRSNGGVHPLGFTVDICPTILEFDNYGQNPNGKLGVSNGAAFYTWGYDDITWFTVQPEWYRNEFLEYVTDYLKTHCLTTQNKQAYYCCYPMRRVITADPNWPETDYTPGKSYSMDFVFDYCSVSNEKISLKFNDDQTFTFTSKGFYRANRQSDGCPNGFNQEDTIRSFFLGEGAAESPKYNTVVLPAGYTATPMVSSSDSSTVSSRTSSASVSGTSSSTVSATSDAGSTGSTDVSGASGTGSGDSASSDGSDSTSGMSGSNASTVPSNSGDVSEPVSTGGVDDVSPGPLLAIAIAAGILLLAGCGAFGYVLYKKKHKKQT